jgi:hypothetical protein
MSPQLGVPGAGCTCTLNDTALRWLYGDSDGNGVPDGNVASTDFLAPCDAWNRFRVPNDKRRVVSPLCTARREGTISNRLATTASYRGLHDG